MATFKPVISYKRADGTYRVQIRIIHNRQKKVISTPIYICGADLTRGGNIKNQAINDQLDKMVSEMRERCNRYGLALKEKTIEQVVEIATSDTKDWKLNFIDYCNQFVERLVKQERIGTAHCYSETIKKFTKYLNREEIDVNDIDRQLISGFARYLEETMKRGDLYLSRLSTIFKNAKNEYNDEDAGIIRIPKSPFNNITITKTTTIKKKALTGEEFARLACFDVSKIKHRKGQLSQAEIAKDMFLLSFYLIGINFADLYEIDTIKDGVLIYNRKKTRARRKDMAEMRVKIPQEAWPIIEKYKDQDGKRVLNLYHYNLLNLKQAIYDGMLRLNKELKIENLSYYSARHTWATWAVNKCGIDKYIVHQALNHVDQKTAITDMYIDRDWKVTDQANRAVIDYSATFVQQLQQTGGNI